ncbi:hypothetical protein I552_10138 [Mycobacterium xenopi 3993]|nr:hypothetical protein I552_10138 [Mycobacterium xenopi 3993]
MCQTSPQSFRIGRIPGIPPILSMMRDRAGNASGENRFVAGRIG